MSSRKTKSIRIVFLFAALLPLPGCLYITDNGLSLFKPGYMDRDRPVEKVDIEILDGALALLDDERHWNHKDDRLCFRDEEWSLFCALAKASVDVTGEYRHRRVALQEARFTINDNFHDRWKKHQLMDFNNNKDTTFDDVRRVLLDTKKRLQQRLLEASVP